MANLRIKVKNLKDLDKMLPKLKRSLSVQYNVEFQEEGQEGVFLLMVKQDIQLNQLVSIKNMLDAYNFEFAFQTVDADGNDISEESEESLLLKQGVRIKKPRQKRSRKKNPVPRSVGTPINIPVPMPIGMPINPEPANIEELTAAMKKLTAMKFKNATKKDAAKELMEAVTAMKKLLEPITNKGVK